MSDRQVPEKKQTVLGLYVMAQEAYEMWELDPDSVHILDPELLWISEESR